MPRSGPNKTEIFSSSVLQKGDAFVVSVNDRVSRATATVPDLSFPTSFTTAGRVAADRISNGDVLNLQIYENVRDEPLLTVGGERVSALTEVQVDDKGFIFVPYAGRIRAAGRTTEELRQVITKELDSQTPDPQVMVARSAGDGATVSVSGGVGAQGVFALERPSRTLSGMLATAGGVVMQPAVAQVRLTRGTTTRKIWLQDLYENPKLDVALRPGDKIVVEEDRRAFVAMGATGTQTRVPFDTQALSALEAIAQVGGLNTNLADPTGVFVLRNETATIANKVLGRSDLRGDQRMIYVLNLTEPMGMFHARDFVIRDGDTLYVTEAPYVQWQKTLGALTGTASAATSLSTMAGTN